MEWNVPRLVVGAPHGHSGKTTVTIGLIAALVRQGYCVQPFKKGPDFIDPSWLGHAAGRACRNLDCYWMDAGAIRRTLANGCLGADIALIEGAMGLYDGVDLGGTGSTAEVARITESPVVLVVDTTRMTRSVAPLVLGFMAFDPRIRIAGVILNKVARPRHENMLRAALKEYCGIPALGAVPQNAFSRFPERHLGLVPAAEHGAVLEAVERNADIAEKHLDIPAIRAIALQAGDIAVDRPARASGVVPRVRIGVVRDRAFTFYYPENLEALTDAGAEIVPVDALTDRALPPVDGLYIGGGFPEVYAAELAANETLRTDIRRAADEGMPIYAECGGLMYLGRSLVWDGREYPMCGVFPFCVQVEKRPQGHGYMEVECTAETPFFAVGERVRGHEFHHSRVMDLPEGWQPACMVLRGHGLDGRADGITRNNVFAAYNHIHASANPAWAPRFVAAAGQFAGGRTG